MKIDALVLNRFGSHLHTDLKDLGKFVVFLGPNGVGKSTLLDALGFALTGVCRGIDDRGSGAQEVVTRSARQDEKGRAQSFGVGLTIGKQTIVRGLGEGPRSKIQADIGRRFGIDPIIARALVQTASFTRLPVAQQKQIVLSVAGSQVSPKDIAALLGQSAQNYGLDSIDSPETADKAYRDLYAARPELKRQLAAIVVPDLPDGAEAAQKDAAEAADQVVQLRLQRDEAIEKAGAARQRRDSAASEQATCKDELAELEKATQAEPEDVAALAKELALTEKAEVENRKKYETLKAEVDQARGQVEVLQQEYARVSKIKGTCPTCQRMLTATDMDFVLKAIKTRAEEVKKVAKPKREALDKLAYNQEDVKKAADLRERISQAKLAQTKKEQAEKRLTKVRELLAQADKILAAPAPADLDTSELDKDIAAGEAYITKQQGIIGVVEQHAQAFVEQGRIQARLTACEDLIEKLGPKGSVRAKFLEATGQEFETEVSEIAQAIGLGPVKLDLSSGFVVTVDDSPASRLSTSEEWRLNLAFAATVARRSGTGLLLLDEASVLVGEARDHVAIVLEQVGLDQAFLGVSEANPPESGPGGEWDFRVVTKDENGHSKVEKLPAPAAA